MQRTGFVLTLAALALSLVGCSGGSGGGGSADVAAPDVPRADVSGMDAMAGDAGVDTASPDTSFRIEEPGGASLVVAWEAGEPGPFVSIERGGRVIATGAAPFVEVATVPAFDASFFYDPYVHPNPFFRREAPGLRWTGLRVASAENAGAAADGAWVLSLVGDDGVTATLRFELEADGTFRGAVSAQAESRDVVFVRLVWDAPEGENYYGLGEVFDQVAQRGTQRSMHMEPDNTQESGYNEAHVPIPFFTGTRGWGLFVEDRHPGAFDMAAADPTRIQVTFYSRGALLFHVLTAEAPLDVPGLYTRLSGAPALPPVWSFAVLQWRDEVNNGAEDVLADAEAMRAVGYPAGAIWVDRPWQTAHSSFVFRPDRFPDVEGMVARLHALGFRLAVWTTPYLTPDVPDAWQDAVEGDLFCHLPDWWPTPFDARMMDLTNPAAQALWRGLIANAVAVGVEGFKLDYAEDIQTGTMGTRFPVTAWNGEDELTLHHHFASFYHQPYADSVEHGFLISRAGTFGDQTLTTTIWPGDLDASFAFHREPNPAHETDSEAPVGWVGGLPAAIIAGQSLSVSGYPWFASDTGGYRGESRPTKELLIRWHAASALLPIMQMGGGENHRPWDFSDHGDGVIYDEETLTLCADYARLHLRLFPYFYAYSVAAAAHGRAVVRPFGLAWPDDGRHPSWTFGVGDWLLVAPVYRAGETERTVPLPAGRWVDWWDGGAYEGPRDLVVSAPLGRLPLFLRAGAIVPLLRPTVDTLSPATEPDVDSYDRDRGTLWVRILPADETRFALHDGGTIIVSDGDAETPLSVSVEGETVYDGLLLEIDWRNRAAAPTAPPSSVQLGGAALRHEEAAEASPGCGCWSYDAEHGVLRVDAGPAPLSVTAE